MAGMVRALARRLLALAATLAVASLLVFLIATVLPGDVGRTMLGPFAPQAAVDQFNHSLGLDRPLPVRYLAWLAGVLTGDWGRSVLFDTAVLPLVLERLGRSLLLAGSALAVLVPGAIAAGTVAARHEGGLFDRALSILALALGALPEFVTGVFLILVFGIAFRLLPIQALPPDDAGPLTIATHLALPVATLVVLLFAYLFRMSRAGVIAALNADYARTAILKGLPMGIVLRRHVLRNALIPTVAVIGIQIGWMAGGLVVVETLFKYPGIGSLTHAAALNKDLPLLMGCALALTALFALGNLLADATAALLRGRR